MQPSCDDRGAGRGVPGVGAGWVPGRAIPGYYPPALQDPIFSIFKAKGLTYGQMKTNLEVSMRFLRYGSRIDQNDLRIDPRIDPPRPSQTGPQIPLRSLISRPQISYSPYKALFSVLLTVADIKRVPSKDWIRPPSRCQL